MRVLRRHTDMLVSVLESFIHDPLVEWQKRRTVAPASSSDVVPAAGAADGVPAGTAAGAERENEDGIRMIRRVRERLSGVYNTGPEWLPSKNGSNSSRAREAAALQVQVRLFGASARPGLAVPGQVHRLIKEATSDENLACMYIGYVACDGLTACFLSINAQHVTLLYVLLRTTLSPRRWLPMC